MKALGTAFLAETVLKAETLVLPVSPETIITDKINPPPPRFTRVTYELSSQDKRQSIQFVEIPFNSIFLNHFSKKTFYF